MIKLKLFLETGRTALLISAIYVGLGTLAVCSVYPKDFLSGEWVLYVLGITFPVSIISFGYRYADSNSLIPVFIIQFVMFLITFLILSIFIKKKKRL